MRNAGLDKVKWALIALLSAPAWAQEIVPIDGLWLINDRPGSGINFATQGDVLVATVYTYDAAGEPDWYIASGPIENGAATLELLETANGTCMWCQGYHGYDVLADPRTFRVRFLGEGHGYFSVDDSEEWPINRFIFNSPGADGLDHTDEFGQAVVPGLFGKWVFTSEMDDSFLISATFTGKPIVEGPGFNPVIFDAIEDGTIKYRFECWGESEEFIAPYCIFQERTDSRQIEFVTVFSAYFSDVNHDRIVGYKGEPQPLGSESLRGEEIIIGRRITDLLDYK